MVKDLRWDIGNGMKSWCLRLGKIKVGLFVIKILKFKILNSI